MHRRILVVPAGQRRPVTSVCLGLVHALLATGVDVGYAKPIAQQLAEGVKDQVGDVIRMVTSLRPPPSVSVEATTRMLATGSMDLLMAEVICGLDDTLARHEIVVVEGLAPVRESMVTSQLNRELAASLDADVLLVTSAAELGVEAVVEAASVAARSFARRVVGVVIEGISPEEPARIEAVRTRLSEHGLRLVAAVPDLGELNHIRVGDLARELRLDIVHEGDLNRRIADTIVAAQAVPGFVDFLTPGRLVIVPGDRHEVLMAAALAESAQRPLAAVLLTAGLTPAPQIMDLCAGALEAGLPLLSTSALTFQTAAAVDALDIQLPADDQDRAVGITQAYSTAFDPDWVRDLATQDRPHRVTTAELRATAMRAMGCGRYTVALAGPFTGAWMHAAQVLEQIGSIRCLFIADPAQLAQVAADAGLPAPSGTRIVDPANPSPELVARVQAQRSCSAPEAVAALSDPLTYALVMLAEGQVDASLGGQTAPGSPLLTLADEFVGRRTDLPYITSANVLLGADEVVVYADCALNEDPDEAQLAAIATLAADGAAAAGVEPKIAFIAQSCEAGGDLQTCQLLRDAVAELGQRRPDLAADGPLDLEAAINAQRAQALRLPGAVAGQASVCVFPDRRTAQATYTAMQRTSGAARLGPLVHGFLKAVNGVPPGSTADEIVDLIGVTLLQSGRM